MQIAKDVAHSLQAVESKCSKGRHLVALTVGPLAVLILLVWLLSANQSILAGMLRFVETGCLLASIDEPVVRHW